MGERGKDLASVRELVDGGRLAAVLDMALRELESPAPIKELEEAGILADPVRVLIDALVVPLPPGMAVAWPTGVDIGEALPLVLADRPIKYHVLVASDENVPATVVEAEVSSEYPNLEVGGHTVRAAEPAAAGYLRLISDDVSRWSVVGERGGACFPDGVVRKFDWDESPFFHGNDLVLSVPAGTMTVTVARGCEFRPITVTVEAVEDAEALVELSPARMYDAAARGWYGGDLHVHLNYSGDYVCTPDDAALMQRGEGLHLMNLLAANCSTALVYDRAALEQFIGQDLPWSEPEMIARWGAEFRNDLMGHFTVLNADAPPTRYQTGHRHSDESQDWPPNACVAVEARQGGGTVTYTHPVSSALVDDGSPVEVFAPHRARISDVRELVVDAALGLVDSVDLGSPSDADGVEYLYHRLLGCGLRLAAPAGSDAMLSHARHWAHSNPPGWIRAYADLGGQLLSLPAWQDALRAGRTFVTKGPWLELNVAGCGLGDTLSCDGPRSVPVVARVVGVGVERLEIIGPDGQIAVCDVPTGVEQTELAIAVDIAEPTWVAAAARGGAAPGIRGPQPRAYADTSPVWIDFAGRAVARPADAAWCLDWLDQFEHLARAKARFTAPGQLDDLVELIERARTFYSGIITAAAQSDLDLVTQ